MSPADRHEYLMGGDSYDPEDFEDLTEMLRDPDKFGMPHLEGLYAEEALDTPGFGMGDVTSDFELVDIAKGSEFRKLRLGDLPEILRGKKAKDMGFDLDVYHGTEVPFDPENRFRATASGKDGGGTKGRYGSGVYVSTSAEDANNWIPSVESRMHASSELPSSDLSPRIYPLKIRSENLIEYEGEDWMDLAEEIGMSRNAGKEKWHRNEIIANAARGEGWDGVFNPPRSKRRHIIGGYLPGEPIDYFDEINTGTEIMIFDPKNIRSRHANFDPTKRHTPDMLAGLAGLLGAGAVRRNYIEREGRDE
tara:strand:+ start:200 stop:1117 length:918 start_codon:yes stop_codon:yes gene_type:complete